MVNLNGILLVILNHITILNAFKSHNLNNNLGAWPWMALLFYGDDDEIFPGCGKQISGYYMHSSNVEFNITFLENKFYRRHSNNIATRIIGRTLCLGSTIVFGAIRRI